MSKKRKLAPEDTGNSINLDKFPIILAIDTEDQPYFYKVLVKDETRDWIEQWLRAMMDSYEKNELSNQVLLFQMIETIQEGSSDDCYDEEHREIFRKYVPGFTTFKNCPKVLEQIENYKDQCHFDNPCRFIPLTSYY